MTTDIGRRVYRDLQQRSPEWLQARCGLLTASQIGQLLTPTGRIADNPGSRALTMRLAAERITGRVDDIPMSPDMWRGVEEEPLARDLYARTREVEVDEVGLIVQDYGTCIIGYSPDGLVGDDGLIEIKSRSQRAQVQTIIDDAVPAANMAQLQTGLLVSGRQWIDYVSYSSGMPLYVTRVTPDEEYQVALIEAASRHALAVEHIIRQYQATTNGWPVAPITPDYTEMVI